MLAGDEEYAAYGRPKPGEVTAVTWERVKEETWRDDGLRQLIIAIGAGFNEKELEGTPAGLADYWRHRQSLTVVDDVVMMGEQIVIPPSLRHEVLDHLHAAHQGVRAMQSRAEVSVFWPGITSDIARRRHNCRTCDTIAPSQPPTDAVQPEIPTHPFQMICSDYFDLEGTHYLVTVDRFTNWVDVRRAKSGTEESGAEGLITAYREVFMALGVPEEVANDGGPEYKSHEFKRFLDRWGVKLRTSSAYHPSANGRAEVAVKAAKRALRDHIGQDGRLNGDEFARALLALRNTPDKVTGKSPAELLLGRRLRDAMPQPYARRQALIDNDSPVDKRWLSMWSEREWAMRSRMGEMADAISAKAHDLVPLELGDRVRVQNQTGPLKTRWSRTGTIVEMNLPYDQYLVKMDGSRRTTPRNRRFLRKIRATWPENDRAGPAVRQARETVQPWERGNNVNPQEKEGIVDAQLTATPGTQRTTPLRPAIGTPDLSPGTRRARGDDGQPGTPPALPATPAARPAAQRETPTRPAIGPPDRPLADRRGRDIVRRHVTFADDGPQPAETGPGTEAERAHPATPAQPTGPPPRPEGRQEPPAEPVAGPRRSGRARAAPKWQADYEMEEMSATGFRRMSRGSLEDNGVEGMKDDDILSRADMDSRYGFPATRATVIGNH